MGEWIETKLGTICEIFTGYPFKGDLYSDKGTLPVVRGENVTIGNLRWDTKKYWNHGVNGLEEYLLKEDDIVIGMDGSRVGRNRAAIKESDLPLILAQRVARLRAKDGISQKLLKYLILDKSFVDYVEAIHTGTSIPHISSKQIADFEVQLPSLEQEQERIAEVLSSLDDKIDLLHRQNQTLEQLAETMFRQWFVEEAEESWITSTVGESFDIKGGGTPPTGEKSYWDGKICWTSPRDLSSTSNIFLHNTERKITEAGLRKVSSGLLPKGVVLLSSRAPIGYLAITNVTTAINQGYIACLPNELYSSWFIHNWLKVSMDLIMNSANGSTFLEIPKSVFRTLDFVVPPREKVVSYNHQAELFYNKILSNEKQINLLEQTRDTLLPKLMSGVVRVN